MIHASSRKRFFFCYSVSLLSFFFGLLSRVWCCFWFVFVCLFRCFLCFFIRDLLFLFLFFSFFFIRLSIIHPFDLSFISLSMIYCRCSPLYSFCYFPYLFIHDLVMFFLSVPLFSLFPCFVDMWMQTPYVDIISLHSPLVWISSLFVFWFFSFIIFFIFLCLFLFPIFPICGC